MQVDEDCPGTTQLLSQQRLQLPVWAKDVVGLTPGTQALIVVDPAGEVRIYPAAALAASLTLLHQATTPGAHDWSSTHEPR